MPKPERTEAVLQAPKNQHGALQNRKIDPYDGFNELLALLADELEVLPNRPQSNGTALQERQLLRNRLQTLKRLLAHPDTHYHQDIQRLAQAQSAQSTSLLHQNLSKIVDEARDLEQTYRELELFYRNAQPSNVKNLTLLNVNKTVLLDADSNTLYNEVKRRLEHESKKIDQSNAYALLVIPKLWESKQPKNLIERYAQLAGASNVLFLTDFADTDSFKETLRTNYSPTWQVYGSEAFHTHLTLFANHLVLRRKDETIGEEEDLRGAPAMAVAGKMYAGKISQPVIGFANGTVSGALDIAFNMSQEEVMDLSKAGLNAMTYDDGKIIAFDHKTAFMGSVPELKSYAVVRTLDYVNRVLRHYLSKVTHEPLNQAVRNQICETIRHFLFQLAQQTILESGNVDEFHWDRDTPNEIRLTIQMEPLGTARTFSYSFIASMGACK